jgi:NAD+ synthetase
VRIALAQINTTVGDIPGNTDRVIDAICRAAEQDAELVVLPELAISGYPPQDLVEREAYVDANEAALEKVAQAAKGIWAVVGHVGRNKGGTGRPAANSASVVRDGEVLARRDKTLLPNYDVFDEMRHFRPAEDNEPVDLGELCLGVTICEDAWNDPHFWPRQLYDHDPVTELVSRGADLVVNLAASPFAGGKQNLRREMLAALAGRHGVPVAYTNLVGGNDQLIFPGRSIFFDSTGRIVAEGASFREDMVLVDTDEKGLGQPPGHHPEQEVWEALLLGLQDYARKCGFHSAVMGLSGGVDSALTAALAVEALGAENVTALFMPTEFSSEQSRIDAEDLAENLGIELHTVPIDEMRRQMEASLEPMFRDTERGVAEENVQARLRGTIVMAYSNKFGALPLATGNKSELAVGYCTLYGDMVGGLAVIGDVPKTMVYRLCDYVNRDAEVIPESILTKPPSAELKPDQTDQDVLPPYDLLDAVLERYIEQNQECAEIVDAGFDPETVRMVLRMVDRAEYKRRQAPITLRVSSRAFGPGRRLPVAQRWPR